MNTAPLCTVHRSCDEVSHWVKAELAQAGLHVMQTFDLQTARHSLEDCPCPHHGMETCDCQIVVLLVYGEEKDPSTLIMQGSDGQTRLFLAETPNHQTAAKTASVIEKLWQRTPTARPANPE